MFTQEELLQLRQHLKCSVIHNAQNESELMEGFIVSGGKLLLKTSAILDEMDKTEQEVEDETLTKA